MNEESKSEPAEYFGLKVEVICRMEHCALVRFGDREVVVDAEDLMFAQGASTGGLIFEERIPAPARLAMSQSASLVRKPWFASKIATLQKVGPIIARESGIPPNVQQSLQTLETSIHTMTRDEFVAYIDKEVGGEGVGKLLTVFTTPTAIVEQLLQGLRKVGFKDSSE